MKAVAHDEHFVQILRKQQNYAKTHALEFQADVTCPRSATSISITRDISTAAIVPRPDRH